MGKCAPFLTFDEEHREALENSFENERLHEVNELLVEGRHETIRFAGVYMEVNGITYVSGIHIVVLDTSILPVQPLSNGMAVVVTGHTNAEGFVDVESIELLPPGQRCSGRENLLKLRTDHNGNDNDNANENENDDVNDNGNSGDDNNVNINDNGNDSNKNDNVNADENENNVENV